MDAEWRAHGALYARLHAFGFAAGWLVVFLLGTQLMNVFVPFTVPAGLEGLPPGTVRSETETAALFRAFLGHRDAIRPLLLGGLGALLVGALALLPVGLTLRELFGRGARQSVMLAWFVAGGLLAAGSVPVAIGDAVVAGLAAHTDPRWTSGLFALFFIHEALEAVAAALLGVASLLLGLAVHRASQLARGLGVLPRGWARLGEGVAALYWAVALGQVARLFDFAPGVAIHHLAVLVGGVVVAPAWALWLARELGRVPDAAATPAR